MSELEKFIRWYNRERKWNKLLDIKFFITPNQNTTLEETFKEINEVISSPSVPLDDDL
jgi:hypothetical protein